MVESVQTGVQRAAQVVGAAQVAKDTEVRQSVNGVRFATFGETGVADLDLDRILEAVPAAIVAALKANTYYFVPLAMRESNATDTAAKKLAEPAMVADAWTDELSDSAICHRNVELGHGKRGVFISTRLLGDRFALSFEFFINVAHAFVDEAGVPEAFSALVWKQAVDGVRGETSLDAWEGRNQAFGREPGAEAPLVTSSRRVRGAGFASRAFSVTANAAPVSAAGAVDEKHKLEYVRAAFSDAVAMYLLSLALDFDYSELREREYPLLSPAALAARLRLVAELFPPNAGYEFAVRYRRRA
jgi:hypothetical protein